MIYLMDPENVFPVVPEDGSAVQFRAALRSPPPAQRNFWNGRKWGRIHQI